MPHPAYKRIIGKRKKFYAHDEQGLANVGDVVRIVECRPLSKLKRWELKEVMRKAVQVTTDLSSIGIAVGIVAAFVLGRVISAMLVGVKSTDPATFAGVTLVFLAISTLASWLPARRAASLDPTKALREQ